MSKDYEVRLYQPGDEEGIVELLELVFDGWPHFDLNCTPLEHWKWKYQDNLLKKMFVAVAVNDGNIIGCDHTMPQKMKIGNDFFFCGTGMDLAVHPDFRKMGINNKLRELKFSHQIDEDMKLDLDVSYNPILIKQNIRRGYPRFPHEVTVFTRINDVELHLNMVPTKNALIKRYGFRIINLFNKIRNTLKGSHLSDESFPIQEINSFSDEINTFWNGVKTHYNFIIEKTKDYLNWRYCDLKGGYYIIKQVKKDDDILGYIILRINKYREHYPTGYIVDLLTLPHRIDVAEALVANAVQYFDKQKINIITYWMLKGNPYEEVFKKHGFVNSKQKLNIFFKNYININEQIEQIQKSDKNKIHFIYGNLDTI